MKKLTKFSLFFFVAYSFSWANFIPIDAKNGIYESTEGIPDSVPKNIRELRSQQNVPDKNFIFDGGKKYGDSIRVVKGPYEFQNNRFFDVHYKNGILDGSTRTLDLGNNLCRYTEGIYVKGKKEGVFFHYSEYDDGDENKFWECQANYKHGQKDGIETCNIFSEISIRSPINKDYGERQRFYKKNGITEIEYDNGNPIKLLNYKDGLNSCENRGKFYFCKLFKHNNYEIGTYSDSVKIREWHPYNLEFFPAGVINIYDKRNHLLSTITYNKTGHKDGPCKTYFINGQVHDEENYKDGELDGWAREYNFAGQVIIERFYVDGRRKGALKSYYPSGQLESVVPYRDGLFQYYCPDGTLATQMKFVGGNKKEKYYKCYDGSLVEEFEDCKCSTLKKEEDSTVVWSSKFNLKLDDSYRTNFNHFDTLDYPLTIAFPTPLGLDSITFKYKIDSYYEYSCLHMLGNDNKNNWFYLIYDCNGSMNQSMSSLNWIPDENPYAFTLAERAVNTFFWKNMIYGNENIDSNLFFGKAWRWNQNVSLSQEDSIVDYVRKIDGKIYHESFLTAVNPINNQPIKCFERGNNFWFLSNQDFLMYWKGSRKVPILDTIVCDNDFYQTNTVISQVNRERERRKNLKNSFVDKRDGKRYSTSRIGGYRWFTQNLNYASNSSLCYDNNNQNCEDYGRLYSKDEADKVCPDGWDLPTKKDISELTKLHENLGKEPFSLKLAGTQRNGVFKHLGNNTAFWFKDSAGGVIKPWSAKGELKNAYQDYFFSVRCIQRAVTIGNQTWQARNMDKETPRSLCYEKKAENCEKYGRLYFWKEAKNVCPTGWHLPSFREWRTLINTAGGRQQAINKLRSDAGWKNNRNGTDDFNFSALPSGFYFTKYNEAGDGAYFCSSTENKFLMFSSDYGIGIKDYYYGKGAFDYSELAGCAVRCIKDNATTSSSFTDQRDNRTYKMITVGPQIWMAENLKIKSEHSWCYNDDLKKCEEFGRLYTWDDAKAVCPAGWHLPSIDEWKVLFNSVGGMDLAGEKLKSASDWDGINLVDFSVLPAGVHNAYGNFWGNGTLDSYYNDPDNVAYFWSSTEIGKHYANSWYFINNDLDNFEYYYDDVDDIKYLGTYSGKSVHRDFNSKYNGLSVRCVKNPD